MYKRQLQALGKVARTPRSTEFVISAMVVALSCIMGLNAPAILAVGASFAKPLAQAQGISCLLYTSALQKGESRYPRP